MASFVEKSIFPAQLPVGVGLGTNTLTKTDDVTIINWTGTNSTFTGTRQDTGGAQTTGTVTFSATDTVAAANMQTAIRALGGIYADATVVAGATADNMVITTFGGYDIVWTKTGGVGVITESGAAGSDTAVVGGTVGVMTMGVGKLVEVKKIIAEGFNETALDLAVVDEDGKVVFDATVDTSTAEADVPYVKLLTADGVAGEDGAAAALTGGGLFRGPFTVTMTNNAPFSKIVAGNVVTPRLSFVVNDNQGEGRGFRKRSSGARTALSGTFNLGSPIAKIRKIRLAASSDTSVAPTVTDADGLVVYTKASTDYTTAVLEQLSHEGVDQAGNAVADLLDVVAKSPLTISGSGLGAGTFTIDVWVEA